MVLHPLRRQDQSLRDRAGLIAAGPYIVADQVVLGGVVAPDDRYVSPTILYPADWEDPALQQEVFGPVLPVLRYTDLDEVLKAIAAKERPSPDTSSPEDPVGRDQFIGRLSFGGGCVNQTNIHCWVDSLPFGASATAVWASTTASAGSTPSPTPRRCSSATT